MGRAVRSGKVLIHVAEGFYDWAARSSMTNMTFKHDIVSSSRCSESQVRAKKKSLHAIKGTMIVHAVV